MFFLNFISIYYFNSALSAQRNNNNSKCMEKKIAQIVLSAEFAINRKVDYENKGRYYNGISK